MSGDVGDRLPTVPDHRLADWTRADASSETVFQSPTSDVVAHTLVYEDDALRAAVRAATDGVLDRPWRFFFATRLTFSPPLPPGVGPATVYSMVAAEAKTEFIERLEGRGFRSITEGRRERLRTDAGERVRVRKYDAVLDVSLPDGTDETLPIEGWFGIWTTGGEFRLAGGAHPAASLGEVFDSGNPIDTSIEQYRDQLFALIRGVE